MTMQHGKEGLLRWGDVDLAEKQEAILREFQQRHQGVEDVALPSAELYLDAELQRQGQDYVHAKYHIAAGFADTDEGKAEFLSKLPPFTEISKKEQAVTGRPLLVVVAGLSWEKQAELAGVSISKFLKETIESIKPYKPEWATPDVFAYTTWVNKWGQGYPEEIKPVDARATLSGDLVGASLFEAAAVSLHFPQDNVDGKYYDVIGYTDGAGIVPILGRWDGGPEFGTRWDDLAYGRFRPLVRRSL
ncbi:MAG: hypothetical protein WD992_02375 [Candidatus Levyibacteriota bacterium]